MNLFDHFWPELFKLGVIHIFRTPLVKVTLKNKSQLEMFTEREFKEWEAKEGHKLKGWSQKYYKGLGTSSAAEFRTYFDAMDNYLFRIDVDGQEDKDSIDLAFNGQRADDRKAWLETPAANFEDFIGEAVA
jgi:DNA topoisomerase-2